VTRSNRPWNDEPIRSAKEDRLKRNHLATTAANLIGRTHSWESSVVFGLSGAWGSGKSSMIDMIEEALRSNHQNWSIAKFTPWSASDTTSLLAEFFAVLDSAIPARKGDKAKKALRACANVASPALKAIPYVGAAASQNGG
jgi:predicted KAP-like P-loop ATPase